MKVLFVDEDWEIEVLVKVLQSRNPQDTFRVADRLSEARREIWAEKWDLLVLDIMMPADDIEVPRSEENAGLMAGLRLADLIVGDARCVNQKTPIVYLTGLLVGENPELIRVKAEQPERFLQKPIHPQNLYAKLLEALGGDKK